MVQLLGTDGNNGIWVGKQRVVALGVKMVPEGQVQAQC